MRIPSRTVWFVILPSLALALCAGGYTIWKASRPRLQLKTCFHEPTNLQHGSKVRIAGVDVGEVQRVMPEIGQCPVDVEFDVYLSNSLRSLPSNATARIETAGILGPSYLGIDLPEVNGPPIGNHGELRTVEYTVGLDPKTAEKLKKFVNDEIDKMTAKPVDPDTAPQRTGESH